MRSWDRRKSPRLPGLNSQNKDGGLLAITSIDELDSEQRPPPKPQSRPFTLVTGMMAGYSEAGDSRKRRQHSGAIVLSFGLCRPALDDNEHDMNARFGSGRLSRPFQLRLRTMMVVVIGIATLLGVLRLLGPDAPVALTLIISAFLGTAVGHLVRRRLRGAIVGGLLPVLYVLSIEVAAHVGHRAAWPTGTLRFWEFYSSLWYNHPIGSPMLWKTYWVWATLCDVLREQYGTDTPLVAQSFINLLAVTAVLVTTARKIHAALLLPFAAVVAGIALGIGHDFDATFFGLACGLVFAIPLDGCGRRKRDP